MATSGLLIRRAFVGTGVVITGWLAVGPIAHAQTPSTPAPQTQPAATPLTPDNEGVSLTPFVGLGFAGDYENSPPAFGVALGYGMSQRLSVEGEFNMAPGGEQGELLQFDTTVWNLSANLLYHFVDGEYATPYVAVGLGMMGADADVEPLVDDDTSTEFAWNLGAGVKTGVSDRIGLRGDLRFFNGDELAPDHWRLYGGVIVRRLGR